MWCVRRALAFALVFGRLAGSWSAASAQGQITEYFPQTGHNVQGDFLTFYHAALDPTTVYGYPITEAFTDQAGALVQYFQRARFEFHAELPPGARVVLTDLGRQMYAPSSQLLVVNPLACRSYSQTGLSVCYSFLDFFDKFGGIAQFGYPLSPFEYQNGMIVQYFDKARLEWVPSNPAGERVVLTDLGTVYFEKLHEDPGRKAAVQPLNAGIRAPVTALRVGAFVQKAVTRSADRQVMYLVVQDQRGQAVHNAVCAGVIHWPDGPAQTAGSLTDENGVGRIPFSFSDQAAGSLVPIDVRCEYNGLIGSSRTSFRIWY